MSRKRTRSVLAASSLTPALPGERRAIDTRAGLISYYVSGRGPPPALLIHSVNAAASAYEVRPIFEHLVAERRCYAMDLPGFGFSDRSPRRYDIPLYRDAIDAMMNAIARDVGPEPVDALAISLSCEFLARAAAERPDRFRSLTFVTPTGFSKREGKSTAEGDQTREIPGLHKFLNVPLWSEALFDLLVSRRSIRYFLRKTWGSKAIDEKLLNYDYLTSHQPGAMNAPYAFVSGRLFNKNARKIYQKLSLPIWMPHGTRGNFGDFSGASWIRQRPNWRERIFASGALPHFEQPEEFMRDYDAFLSS